MPHVKLSSIIFSEMIELPSILPPLAPPDRPPADRDDYPFDFQRQEMVSVRNDVTEADAMASLAEDTERIVMGVTDTSTSFAEHRALSKVAVAYVRAILENSEGTLRSGSKNINTKRKGAFRIQPVDAKNPPAPDMVLSFIRSAGLRVVQVIPPGAEEASSSKFNTYVLRGKPATGRPVQFKFVYGQGRNAGHAYEDDIRDQLQRLVESKGKTSSRFINELAAKIGSFTPKDIVDYRYTANGQLIRRPLSDKPMNVGALVADFVLVLRDGRTVPVSLKARRGLTVANGGYDGSFQERVQANGRVKFVPKAHPLDKFLVGGCGVDKSKMALGIASYVNQTRTAAPAIELRLRSRRKVVLDYLLAAFGHGYYYVKQLNDGSLDVLDLTTKAKVRRHIGKVTSIVGSYPRHTANSSSKQMSIWINTTKAVFKTEVRNSSAGVLPNEIKVAVVRSID
jgi:hypothetical protein